MKKTDANRIREFVMQHPTACNERIARALRLRRDQVRRAVASDVGRGYMDRSEVDGVRWLELTPAGRNVVALVRNSGDLKGTVAKVKMMHPGDAKMRRCLMTDCGKMFASEGPGHRICNQCKQLDSWRAGVA